MDLARDALFLAMPATQAFHRRYKRCQDELRKVTTKIPLRRPFAFSQSPAAFHGILQSSVNDLTEKAPI